LRENRLPIGLAHGVKLRHPIAKRATVGWDDVEVDGSDATVIARREMEQRFAGLATAAE
jgi:predicted homoserine dehydrogenase-like protein